MLRLILVCWLIFSSIHANAHDPRYPTCEQTNHTINTLYTRLQHLPMQHIAARIVFISQQFLGKPYALNALGEGAQGYFDQTPLYRTDAFDCETYVDTVLALALANDLSTFKQYIQRIRYHEGQVSFIHRNHFTCLDWNKNNQKQGILKDITASIHDEHNQPLAVTAHAFINKPSWYHHFSNTIIRLRQSTPAEQSKRLHLLKQKGKTLSAMDSSIPYIPLTALLTQTGHANDTVFQQIPNGAIIEMIRPNWDLSKTIGTHLNVSHLGFAVWKKGTLFFLQASSTQKAVVQTPLVTYLRHTQASPTIKGIHVQVVKNPLRNH